MPNEKESELLRHIRLLYKYYMIKQGSRVAVSLPSLGRRGGRSESREKISSPRHTPVTPRSSRPVSKLSLLALGATRQAILALCAVNRYPITSRLQAAYQPEEAIVQFTAYCFWPLEQTDTWCNRSIMAEQDGALSWSWWSYLCWIHR